MFMLKVGETHDLEDECYLKSEIALLSGFCVCWYSVKDKIAAM